MSKRYLELKKDQEIVKVKDGWCWWAIFSWLWSWSQHLGWQTGWVLFFFSELTSGLSNVYYIIRGNGWILEKYLKQGYVPVHPINVRSWGLKRTLMRLGYGDAI